MAAVQVFLFDDFQVHADQRRLLHGGQAVPLGSRAFDLLVALCQRPGQVVSNRELLAAAWPNRVVEEGSVRVHIASLRKALGDGVGARRYISNVPMRGYCMVVPVESRGDIDSAPPHPPAQAYTLDLQRGAAMPVDLAATQAPAPDPMAEEAAWRQRLGPGLIGREREAAALMQDLRQHRCVTLVGTGGIGKTSVALPVARHFAETEGAELVLVELAALSQGDTLATAIASALGVVVTDLQPLRAITRQWMGDRRLLLVLDNCEHVIEDLALVGERILSQSPGLRLLATSREALRIQGEWVRRLEPLPVPPPAGLGGLPEALQYAAVRLFVERANAAGGGLEVPDDEVGLLCQLCRRLDGIPLAIELAAGAVETVGLRGLTERLGSRLGNRLVLVGRGRRTALPRHQTLRATLDWSYGLLPEAEQALLTRLAIFRGVFTHEAALAVFGRSPEALDEGLAGLVAKSMVVSQRHGADRVYRLLETTREYASERLAASGELEEVSLHHAQFLLAMLQATPSHPAAAQAEPGATAALRWIDDLREAVAWAAQRPPTRALGAALLAWGAAHWFSLALLAEYRQLAEAAVHTIGAESPTYLAAGEEMRLSEALGHALWHTRGDTAAMAQAFSRGLALAEQLAATPYRLRCRWGLWLVRNAEGDHEGSRRLAEQFGEVAAGLADPAVQLAHARMMALGCHFQGDQAQARVFGTRVLQQVASRSTPMRRQDAQFDPRVAGLTVMARVLWLQGCPEQALQHAQAAVNEAMALEHDLSLCFALAIGAVPVACWCGDLGLASAWAAVLKQRADRCSFHYWQAFGHGYQHAVNAPPDQALPANAWTALAPDLPLRETLCTLHPGFLDDRLAQRALQGGAGWCGPELLRLVGENHLQLGHTERATAAFRQGWALAREQQALAWELRCSTSLALASLTPAGTVGRPHRAAHAELSALLSRFTEGLATPDLQRAHAVLRQLDNA